MKDKRAEEVVKIFKDAGMTIEPGAHFSVKGQIAQLLNGSEALQAECEKLRKDVAGLLICDECHDKCADPYTGLFASHCPDEEPCIMCECSSLRRQLAEQQSAPDVTALVEALEEAYGTLERAVSPADETPEAAIQSAMFVIDAALAAHRKQGGEV